MVMRWAAKRALRSGQVPDAQLADGEGHTAPYHEVDSKGSIKTMGSIEPSNKAPPQA
jgi:hypothetical protein